MRRAQAWQRLGHRCTDTADWLMYLPATGTIRRLLMALAIRAHTNYTNLVREAAAK